MGRTREQGATPEAAPTAIAGWPQTSFSQLRGNAAAQEELAAKTGGAAFRQLATQRPVDPTMGNPSAGATAITAALDDARAGRFQAGVGQLPANGSADVLAQVGAAGIGQVVTLRNQLQVVADIRAVVPTAHFPPTPDELEAWFRSVSSDARRGEAEGMFTRYTQAFHVHAGLAGQPSDDIEYDTRGHSARAADGSQQQVHGPTQWAQVLQRSTRVRGEGPAGPGERLTDAAYRGRFVNDCEGYAFMADRLMRAAGFQVSHVAADEQGGPGLHAMTTVTDPATGRSRVQSNDRFFDDEVSGYRSGFPSSRLGSGPTFYRGATQDQSLANLSAAQATRPRR